MTFNPYDSLRSANVQSTADLQIRGEGELFVRSNKKERIPLKWSQVKYSPNISELFLVFKNFPKY